MTNQNLNADFPYESRYVEVLDSRIHYVESGEGDPIVFLHGNPTSSYIWRNIIPYLSRMGRCIAPDLIGMGKSGRPNLEYNFADQSRYLEAFLVSLDLDRVTLVMHDWGAALGLQYAMRHEDHILGLALMEPVMRPMRWRDFGWIAGYYFRKFRSPVQGAELIIRKNFLVEKVIPAATCRKLSGREMAAYRAPFTSESERKPVWMFLKQVPIDGEPSVTHESLKRVYEWLEKSGLPKLLLWAKPGAIIQSRQAKAFLKQVLNAEAVMIGRGKHYLQEDQPHNIGIALTKWYKKISAFQAHEIEV